MIKDSVITENYAAYCSDCMFVMLEMPDNSIDLSVYSPPFLSASGKGLYQYSSHENDLSNNDKPEDFLRQYEYMVEQIARLTKPGCISAVHCCDIMKPDGELLDFPGEIKAIHKKYGFVHRNTVTIWKEPLEVRRRTMVQSLMHKFIVEDASECFTAMPDYLLIFKKKGKREKPVEHPFGLFEYAGKLPLLPEHLDTYGLPFAQYNNGTEVMGKFQFDFSGDNFGEKFYQYSQESFKALQKKYENFDGPQIENKRSHLIWQRYASSIWDDIRLNNVLPFQDSKDEDDEKHVHPLQLDVIDRVVELYSNKGEVVFTPFMGVGSEVFSPVSMGRKAIGVELKESYFKQAVLNLKEAEKRFKESKKQLELELI